MMRPTCTRLRAEDGFTVIELLVGSSISVVLLLATLMTFDAFSSASARNDKLVQTEDAMRDVVDTMSTEIRNAQISSAAGSTPLLRADAVDLVVRNYDASGAARLIRYCVDTTNRSLYREFAADGTALPVGCPATSGSWSSVAAISKKVANTVASTDALFKPNTTSPLSSIRSVGISLWVDTGTGSGRTTKLATAAALRSSAGRPLGLSASDVGFTCQPDGTALLSLAAGTDEALTAVATTSGGVSIGGFSLQNTATVGASVQGALTIVVTNPLGLQQILFKTVSCP